MTTETAQAYLDLATQFPEADGFAAYQLLSAAVAENEILNKYAHTYATNIGVEPREITGKAPGPLGLHAIHILLDDNNKLIEYGFDLTMIGNINQIFKQDIYPSIKTLAEGKPR